MIELVLALCLYRAHGALPDLRCTPGFADPFVTDTNVDRTICLPEYEDRVRPNVFWQQQTLRASRLHYGDTNPSAYRLDFLIPLSLGGAAVPGNAWPIPVRFNRPKNLAEGTLHRLVCEHVISLWAARALVSTDWRG